MKVSTHKVTPSQLKYRILCGTYGFVDNEWYHIHKNKPIMPIYIEITDHPQTEKQYQEWVKNLNVLGI